MPPEIKHKKSIPINAFHAIIRQGRMEMERFIIKNRRMGHTVPCLAALLAAAMIFTACALTRDLRTDEFSSKCSHCHGENLQGINNAREYCGRCHDSSAPLPVESLPDSETKSVLMSEPHVHRAANLYTGTPSCFYCHRNGSF
jgi:hypothetical protein